MAFVRLLAVYPLVVAVLSVLNVVAPQRVGPLALSQVFAPHLLIPVLVLVPVAAGSASHVLRVSVVLALAIGAVRFGPGLVSLPASPPSPDEVIVRILSWNLEGAASATEELIARLRASDADIVAVQELTHAHASAIRADPELAARYSNAVFVPRGDAGGLGVLSRFPITLASDDRNPAVQVVELLVDDRPLTIINAHPFAPEFPLQPAFGRQFAYDPTRRDADILKIRVRIDETIATGRRLIVLGDFNVTDREPGWDDLTRGLWDAHDEVGQGTGSSWRPGEIDFVPFGLLRIDYFLGGPGTRALSVAEDCAPSLSDHCVLTGSVAIR